MFLPLLAPIVSKQHSLPALHIKGTQLVDGGNRPVLLKGCNLGNWLINEFWMLGTSGRGDTPGDQYELENILTTRFGAKEDRRLMDLYRSSWMTERDWQNIQSFKFNLVRLPFNYRLLEDDENPKHLRPDAWVWLDRAVDAAERHGMYVILDLHGVQGSQSWPDHTGRAAQNKFWSTPEDQDRFYWIWPEIAKHFRHRNAVIAYDPINEPYGGTKPKMVEVFSNVYTAIRKADPDKLIFAHGMPDSFAHFGDPKAHGWRNVGFQMHYYPGVFGEIASVKTTARHLLMVPRVANVIRDLNVPFLVGEMNVVLSNSGGAAMMRRFYDAYGKNGWITTMWSYKVLTDKGGIHVGPNEGAWGMVTNREPAQLISFKNAPKEEIEKYFASFAKQPLDVYHQLRSLLTARNPVLPAIPPVDMPRTKAPADQTLPGWIATDVSALKGGLVVNGDGSFDLYGEGSDIWASDDHFRFLHQEASSDFVLTVTLRSEEATASYTKAGLMVRDSLSPDSATAVLSVFPTGGTELAVRDTRGAQMTSTEGPKDVRPQNGGTGPKLSIVRKGTVLSFYVNGQLVGERTVSALAGPVIVGPIALSHSEGELTKITYEGLSLVKN